MNIDDRQPEEDEPIEREDVAGDEEMALPEPADDGDIEVPSAETSDASDADFAPDSDLRDSADIGEGLGSIDLAALFGFQPAAPRGPATSSDVPLESSAGEAAFEAASGIDLGAYNKPIEFQGPGTPPQIDDLVARKSDPPGRIEQLPDFPSERDDLAAIQLLNQADERFGTDSDGAGDSLDDVALPLACPVSLRGAENLIARALEAAEPHLRDMCGEIAQRKVDDRVYWEYTEDRRFLDG